MPQLPQVQERESGLRVRSQEIGPAPGAYIGKALGEASDTYLKLQDGADKAQATKIIADTKAKFDGALQDASDTISDPTEFSTTASQSIKDLHDSAVSLGSTPQAQKLVKDSLSNDLIINNRKIKQTAFQKTHDRALGDYAQAKDQLINSAVTATDDNQAELGRMFGQLTANMVHNGFMKADKGGEELVDFKNKVPAQRMALQAKNDPIGLQKDFAKGKFQGVRPTDVQIALDIAGKTLDLQARRDAQEGKQLSDAAERNHEQLASERKLNMNQLLKDQQTFGWSKEKVDGLIRMQVGLKVANPYEALVIEDAMQPVDKSARYTMSDIQAAERGLKKAAADGNVDTRTPEYRAAMRRLQSMTTGLEVRGDIKDSRSEFDARQSLFDLYHKYFPKKDSKQLTSERADHLRRIDEMPASDRRQYIKELEQKFEKQKVENAGPKVNIETLRGIPRR